MKTDDDDLADEWKTKKRSKLHDLADVAAMVCDEEEYAKKGKSKIVYDEDEDEESEQRFFHHFPRKSSPPSVTGKNPENPFQNLNGASTAMLVDRNQIPFDFGMNCIKLRCPPSSSSLLGDYKISADSDTKNPQNPRFSMKKASSLLLLLDFMTELKNPRNPNSQLSLSWCLTERKSRKRQRKQTGGLKKKAKVARLSWVGKETPEWVVQLNGAEDVRLIFEKTLLATDVNPSESRLLIPFKTLIRNDFLTPVESRFIQEQGDNKIGYGKPGIGAILVNEKPGKWGVILKIWKMKGTDNYALTCGWNDFVVANRLKLDDNIGLWSFRCRGILCFALLVTPPTFAQNSSSLAL